MNRAMSIRLMHQTFPGRAYRTHACAQPRPTLASVAVEMGDDELRRLATGKPFAEPEIDATFLRIGDRPGYRRS